MTITLTDDFTVAIADALLLDEANGYIVGNVDGFGIPQVRNGDNPAPSDRGSYFGRDFIGQRMFTVSLTVVGDDPSDALDNYEALMGAWQLDTPDSTASMPLRFKLPGRDPRRVNGRPRDVAADMSTLQASQIPCTLLFATSDPSILSDSLNTNVVGLQNVGTGRTYPLTFPRVYGGGSSGGTILAVNSGNYPTRPVATIGGPCVNPRIENIGTGEFMELVIALGSSDLLVIDFDAKTIELNGASRYSAKTFDSTWWELAPGTTDVHFTANAFTLGATCELDWRSAWML